MATAEETIKAFIERVKGEAIREIDRDARRAKEDITNFTREYLESLHVELPKDVLELANRGGQVRQVVVNQYNRSMCPTDGTMRVNIQAAVNHSASQQAISLDLPYAPKVRITFIVEPLEETSANS